MRRIQLHATGLNLFARCGEAFRKRYLDGKISPPPAYMIVGRGVDGAFSADLSNKLKRGALLGVGEIRDIATGVVEKDFTEEIDLRDSGLPKMSARALAVDRAVKFSVWAHDNLAPTIFPKSLQRAWSIRLDKFLHERGVKGVKIDFVGSMDVEDWVYDFGPRDETADTGIRDLKTSARSPSSDAADGKHFIQLTSYALGKRVLDGKLPARVQVDYLVDLKRGTEHRPIVGTRDDYDLAALFNRIHVTAQALKTGSFLPAPRDHWCCSLKYCGYYQTCPYVKNAHTVDLHVPAMKDYKLVQLKPATKYEDEG
jgi:hypothetical protein